MLQDVDAESLEREKDLWWAKFWQRSWVDFSEEPIQSIEERVNLPFEPRPLRGYYYGMMYMLGGSYAPGKVATSHYGVYNTHDAPQCNGQMTLDCKGSFSLIALVWLPFAHRGARFNHTSWLRHIDGILCVRLESTRT